jgi:hypothetical protein
MELLLNESNDRPEVVKTYDANKSLKYGIWAYYLLLIFEGALRKWFLPGLATPLLVIRDPIALWLVYISLKRGILPSTPYLYGMLAIGLISMYLAMFVSHGNFIVALFGARILLIHYPLMFVIGSVFDREDVLKMGKATLYIAIPMAVLLTMQFYSPQSAWVNRGLAGDLAGAGFSGSGEYKRPPGTFSFISGTIGFFGLLAPFLFYYWFNLKQIKLWLLIGASVAMLIAIPFSISRALLFEFVTTLLFVILASFRKPENLSKVFVALIVGLIGVIILSQTKFFNTAIGAFTERFTSANEQEGGLVKGVIGDRFFGGLITALTQSSNQPFWGHGIGMGTNVGAMLLTGSESFLIAEGEWGRLVGELGPLLGLLVIALRIGLTGKLAVASYKKMTFGDILPWLLLSNGILNISQGGWSQPTSLGFFVMIGGLLIASLNTVQTDS